MKIEYTPFQGLILVEPSIFKDERGYFFEPYNEARFRIETGINASFVQDNESMSNRDVLRGLHFQIPPKAQAKLIRVSRGSVLDVVVDLRKTQPTYGQHFKTVLSADNKKQLYVPEGFAHGFKVLEDQTIFTYKCSNYYSKDHDRALLWNDPDFGIDWEIDEPVLSEKDRNATRLKDFDTPFF